MGNAQNWQNVGLLPSPFKFDKSRFTGEEYELKDEWDAPSA